MLDMAFMVRYEELRQICSNMSLLIVRDRDCDNEEITH